MGHAAPKPIAFPDAEGPVLPEGNNHPRREFFWARGAGIRRGVRPWHARRGRPRNLGGPRLSSTKPRLRGEPVTRLRRTTRWRAHVSSAAEAQKKRPQRGRPPARGTGAVAKGGRESEGCIRAVTSGNGMPPRTRPSKGGPCWCELQEGTMPNALTLADMSPGLLEVVEKHESHQRKSRMVEISLSGSGEGLGWATAQPTLQWPFPPTARACPAAHPVPPGTTPRRAGSQRLGGRAGRPQAAGGCVALLRAGARVKKPFACAHFT